MHVAAGRLHVGMSRLGHHGDRVRTRGRVIRDRGVTQIVERSHLPLDAGRCESGLQVLVEMLGVVAVPARRMREDKLVVALERRSAPLLPELLREPRR